VITHNGKTNVVFCISRAHCLWSAVENNMILIWSPPFAGKCRRKITHCQTMPPERRASHPLLNIVVQNDIPYHRRSYAVPAHFVTRLPPARPFRCNSSNQFRSLRGLRISWHDQFLHSLALVHKLPLTNMLLLPCNPDLVIKLPPLLAFLMLKWTCRI
jgi:hypothetical protein